MSKFQLIKGGRGSLAGGGEPPHDGDMEARVANLERTVADVRESMARMEAKIDSIDRYGATKDDVSRLESTLIKWMVGTVIAVGGLAFAIARFVT